MKRLNALIAVGNQPISTLAADGAALAVELMSAEDTVLQRFEVGDVQCQGVHERPRMRTTGLPNPCLSSTKLVQPR
ncbi:hypothetical protein D3C76_1768560 [compost metagenome]